MVENYKLKFKYFFENNLGKGTDLKWSGMKVKFLLEVSLYNIIVN